MPEAFVNERDCKDDRPDTVRLVSVPTEVNEDVTTLAAKVVPVSVPAGAMTTLPEAAVISPFPLTVKVGIEVEEPNEPTLPLTVAKVAVTEPGPDAITSPVRAVIAFPTKGVVVAITRPNWSTAR